jgi:tRNA A-37 threonylcarbamoyl transferase component Bud32
MQVTDQLLRHLKSLENEQADKELISLYSGEPKQLATPLASLHQRLNVELDWINHKAPRGRSGHFNADNSRALIALCDEIASLQSSLLTAGITLTLASEYARALASASEWLMSSGGSSIPEGLTPISIAKFAPVFFTTDIGFQMQLGGRVQNLQLIGEGAFAVVHKFVDPLYEKPFARKKLKQGLPPRDIERFRREYELTKSLSFPYILDVYSFNESDNSYTMEYCDSTLRDYIRKNNSRSTFDFVTRRRIALQFLYGLNFIHIKGHFHRDISAKNVLLKVYEAGAVSVRLSDFGLAKQAGSQFTSSDSEKAGTHIDPALDKFKDFNELNDIYVVGFILSLIFTGKESLATEDPKISNIVLKCSNSNPASRYTSVKQIITALENIEV